MENIELTALFIVFLLLCVCVPLFHFVILFLLPDVMGWTMVCDCCISWLYHGCSPVREIFHSLKLVDYLQIQGNKPLFDYYIWAATRENLSS